MATTLAIIAIAGFGQLPIRAQGALCVQAPENASIGVVYVSGLLCPDEHAFAAQRRAKVRTIRI